MTNPTIADLTNRRVIPVVVLEDAAHAVDLGAALLAGGLPITEITLRTDAALDSIAAASTVDGLIVGAGSVLNASQARDALAAGARFIVSPGLDEGVVRVARDSGVVAIPGAVTPTEIMQALALNLTHLKFFPASTFGGVSALKALASVFRGVSFMPTGGVSLSNLGDYLALPQVAAVGGSWMVPGNLISTGQFEAIAALCAEAVSAAAPTTH